MNAAIKWMMDKATVETLEDGTVTYFFQGTLPSSMKNQIIKASELCRSGSKTSTYSASGETFGWGATFGARKSTQFSVNFVYNDYTVPASKVN